MIIRHAATADVVAVASMVERYWEFEAIAGFEPRRIEQLLSGLLSRPERGALWVAEAHGSLRGYLLAVFVFSLEHGGTMAEIDEFFVAPESRSFGLGSALLMRAELDLAARGVVRLQLQIGVDNHRARGFYERHGYLGRAGYELLDKPLRHTFI